MQSASQTTGLSLELFHVQTNTNFKLPLTLSVIRIGKPNDQVPPDIDVSGLPDVDVVSRIHAEIRVQGSNFFIEDLGSSNGTFLNNTKLEPKVRYSLNPGDKITLGQAGKVTFIFQNKQTSVSPPSQTSLPKNAIIQDSRYWPWKGSTLHPAVANMPTNVEVSIESVARYIAQQEPDPYLRVKALHDYVADRIAYDAPAYFGRSSYPDQDARTVFQTRKAVCAGYAKLLEALGKAIGEEIVYIVGNSRSLICDLGEHAWNAAKIEGRWYLIDATWDSGYVNSSGFTKRYCTDYLFSPPEVLVISHFPDDPIWQLLPKPLDRSEFLRQPMMQPRFFAEDLKLISPTRSQTDVRDTATIQIDNPSQRWLMVSCTKKGEQQGTNCGKKRSPVTQISCLLPDAGTYEVRLFSSKQQFGEYAYVGQVEFNKQNQ